MFSSWVTTAFTNNADYAALATFTSEASLLGTVNEQPWLVHGFFDQNNRAAGRAVLLKAAGVVSCTSTPTYTFQVRLGTTAGSTYLSGKSLGVSAAITMQSGVTNSMWELEMLILCNTPGIGTGNTILTCAGSVKSFDGFAAPYSYPLEPTTPPTAAWTQTIDNSLDQYFNLSVACGTSNSANTIRLKQLSLLLLN